MELFAKREDEAAKLFGLLVKPLGVIPSFTRQESKCQISVFNTENKFKVIFELFVDIETKRLETGDVTFPKIVAVAVSSCRPLNKNDCDQDSSAATELAEPESLATTGDVPLDVLRTRFHHSLFRHCQRQVIDSILKESNTMTVMPTGGGKTICFLVPALVLSGVTVVIVPFNSLMYDLLRRCIDIGINAKCINQHTKVEDLAQIIHDLHDRRPQINIVITTPESLQRSDVKSAMNTLKSNGQLNCFVIDEIHCMSQSSHQFRPDYKLLSQLKDNPSRKIDRIVEYNC